MLLGFFWYSGKINKTCSSCVAQWLISRSPTATSGPVNDVALYIGLRFEETLVKSFFPDQKHFYMWIRQITTHFVLYFAHCNNSAHNKVYPIIQSVYRVRSFERPHEVLWYWEHNRTGLKPDLTINIKLNETYFGRDENANKFECHYNMDVTLNPRANVPCCSLPLAGSVLRKLGLMSEDTERILECKRENGLNVLMDFTKPTCNLMPSCLTCES